MTHKLPLWVRQHYTSRPTATKDGWFLRCDKCGKTFNLLRPPPGKPVEEFGLRMLQTHTHSHRITPDMYTLTMVVNGGQNHYDVVHGAPVGEWELNQVQKVEEKLDTYQVVVRAGNKKHAFVVGRDILSKYLAPPPTHRRRHWRYNP